ncbi:hypothetical protein [Sinisalibacter aestuarii]|uniref:hypothetical protein n=1 Tax=Sinisalibacter aestuarii TaxID=2949426 RepID=UPI00248FBC82|nr:hypothetical protein [Sinisalibacter aestuarii]
MDGEVAQLAALVISANHRLTHPDDPMLWFATQRAFARCGAISFEVAAKQREGGPARVTMAETPRAWLDQLARSGTKRVLLGFERQDEEMVPGETIPDRVAAGFAGGGSLWTMTTETDDGRALGWRSAWKAAYPGARDGRIWAVRYTATASDPQPAGRDLDAAATELRHALAEMSEFAWSHDAKEANLRFTAALALLEGAPDPRPFPHSPGAADTLSDEARRLLHAAQRGWMFDDMGQWGPLKVDEPTWRDHARRSEALYDAVTAAVVAAANSSAPARPITSR